MTNEQISAMMALADAYAQEAKDFGNLDHSDARTALESALHAIESARLRNDAHSCGPTCSKAGCVAARQRDMIASQRSTIEALMVGAPDDTTTPVIRKIAALEAELSACRVDAERYRVGHERYETVRRMNVPEFRDAYVESLRGCRTFDELVDAIGAGTKEPT
jgi:hypothetical protein